MKNLNLKKSLVALTTAALVSVFAVAIPSSATAATTCEKDYLTVNGKFVDFQKCTGTDDRGSKYEIRMPAKFNGTMMLYSHGIRYPFALPALGLTYNDAPDIAPSEEVGEQLLSQGFALAGAGVQVQGWNQTEQVYASLFVNNAARTQFPAINKVVAWGQSLGALSTQAMVEQYPGLFDAVGPLCLADSASAQLTGFLDFIWGLKTFFDPTIKGSGYSAGQAGLTELQTDIGKAVAIFTFLSNEFTVNPLTPAWPATSTATALMSGISTQSKSFDSSSGPVGPLETAFGGLLSPVLAILENGSEAAVLGFIANYDLERRAGGRFYDNTNTDYIARLGADAEIFTSGLSGASKGLAGFGAYLNKLNPAAPRVKADPDALARHNQLYQIQGKITAPTVTITALADHITPPGATQYLADQYASSVTKGESTKGLLVNIWNKPPDEYTTFTGQVPNRQTVAVNGVGHCNFTTSQYMTVAKLLGAAAKSGKAPSAKTVSAAIKNDSNLFVDPNYRAPLLKYRQ
jgi:pimeloyl-ACP methyl ester carboxylesterase